MADAVETRNPDYSLYIEDWQMMRRTYRGSREVKNAHQQYLPMPDGFANQSDGGSAMYRAYEDRAMFPELVEPTILGMLGIVHRNEAKVELPKALEPIRERATLDGMTLDQFHTKITNEILIQGRYGILTDVPQDGANVPYMVGYAAETLINWDENRSMYALDESAQKRNGFAWSEHKKFRVLELEAGKYTIKIHEDGTVTALTAQMRGGSPLTEIPFVVVGPIELTVKPQKPPLLGVAEAALGIRRLDADYRHALFMTANETLVLVGFPAQDNLPTVVGAGVIIGLPTGADAKYVGISGRGIEATRQAMNDLRDTAITAGSKMFDSAKGVEAAEALRLKFAAKTATLTTVAKASAAALERALRYAATFMGADPQEVVVKPNLKLVDATLTPTEAQKLVLMWQAQAISYTTLYENLQRGEIASPERTPDDELALIEQELPSLPPPPPAPNAFGANDPQPGAGEPDGGMSPAATNAMGP